MVRDFYETLGVTRSATEDEIKRAYRKLAKQYHPDRNPDDAASEAKFKEVQEAHQTLGDPKKRAEYDQFGAAGVGQWQTGPQGQRVYQWAGGSSVGADDLEDLFSAFGGGGQHASIFDQFFGGSGGRRSAPPRPQRGRDEEREVSLSFEQAVHGATLTVRLGGAGGPQELEVKIPPGVSHGQKIRVAGRIPGRHNSPPGDLLLRCTVRPHAYFTRRGDDIYIDVPVSVEEAVLGAKIEVPSLDGRLTVTLPAGTPSGAKMRLAGHGVRKHGSDQRGDEYVVIRIVPPKTLSDEQRRLFERIREQHAFDPRIGSPWNSRSAK